MAATKHLFPRPSAQHLLTLVSVGDSWLCITVLTNGSQFAVSPTGCSLRIFRHQPASHEAHEDRKGQAHFAPDENNDVIFSSISSWACRGVTHPFSIQTSTQRRRRKSLLHPGTRAILTLPLIDTATNLLKVPRHWMLDAHTAEILRQMVSRQPTMPLRAVESRWRAAQIQATTSTSSMVKEAQFARKADKAM